MQDLGTPPSICFPARSGKQSAIIAAGVAAAVLAALLALVLVLCCKRRSAGKAHPHGKPPVRLLFHFFELFYELFLLAISKNCVVKCYQTTIAQQDLAVTVHGARKGMSVQISLC
jgi:hypothetical protein